MIDITAQLAHVNKCIDDYNQYTLAPITVWVMLFEGFTYTPNFVESLDHKAQYQHCMY